MDEIEEDNNYYMERADKEINQAPMNTYVKAMNMAGAE